jgi:hypothetical protein
MRVSWLRQDSRAVSGREALGDWTDPDRAMDRARSIARADEQLSAPALSFDGDPSRLAWRELAAGAGGRTRTIFVAGDTAYEKRGGSPPSIGS